MKEEIKEYQEFLQGQGYSNISLELSWAGQQPPGTAKRLVFLGKIIKRWQNERRERESSTSIRETRKFLVPERKDPSTSIFTPIGKEEREDV